MFSKIFGGAAFGLAALKNRRKIMDLGYDVVVTISGMVLVFLILIILMVIIMLEGKAFNALSNKKRPAAPVAPKPEAPAAPQQQAVAPVEPEPQPQVEPGIPGDVIAAIAAAIYALGGGKYTLRAVRRADRGGWSKAGVSDTTAPL